MANPLYQDGSLLKQPKEPKQPRRRSPKRGKGPRKVSEKQAKRTAFLHGVKAERLEQQSRAMPFPDDSSHFGCEGHGCQKRYRSWEEAWNELTLHHTVKRSKGHGYVDYADFGVDEPRLLVLVCRSCHQALESNPMFTKESA